MPDPTHTGATVDAAAGRAALEAAAELAETAATAMHRAAHETLAGIENPDVSVVHQFTRLLAAARAVHADAERHRRALRLAERCDTTGAPYRFVRDAHGDITVFCAVEEPPGRAPHPPAVPAAAPELTGVTAVTQRVALPAALNPDDLSELRLYLTDPLRWVHTANRDARRLRALGLASEVLDALVAAAQLADPAEFGDDPVTQTQWLWVNGAELDDTELTAKLRSANQTVRLLVGRTEPLGARIHALLAAEHRTRFAPRD